MGQLALHGGADVGELVHQRQELAMPDDEEARETLGADGRSPNVSVQERDLSEEVTRMQLGHEATVLVDRDVSVDDDEELLPEAALLGEDGVETDLDLVGELPETLELPPPEPREERNAPEVLELLVGCHGSQCTDASKGSAPDV